MISIEELAKELELPVWSKGDIKRIYIKGVGHNTKKMSTTTYVWKAEDGFKIHCHIKCPSQAYQWIISQEQKVKESVEEVLNMVLADYFYLAIREDNGYVFNGTEDVPRDVYMQNGYDKYLTKDDILLALDDKAYKYEIVKITREEVLEELENLKK